MDIAYEKPSIPLADAVAQLREIVQRYQQFDPRGQDTGTLERMLVHMQNIHASVTASTKDHVNAGKRLKDFAETLGRMAGRLPRAEISLDARMHELSKALRAEGIVLSGAAPVAAVSIGGT